MLRAIPCDEAMGTPVSSSFANRLKTESGERMETA